MQWKIFLFNDQASAPLLLESNAAVPGLLAAGRVNISEEINMNNQYQTARLNMHLLLAEKYKRPLNKTHWRCNPIQDSEIFPR